MQPWLLLLLHPTAHLLVEELLTEMDVALGVRVRAAESRRLYYLAKVILVCQDH